jgi:hypothetical protein
MWANEALLILEDNLMAANLCRRDFEPTVARMGDTVNTRRISTFTAKRKTNADNVTDQDAVATNVPVTLNQHVHVSFVLKDGEMSLAFKDLVTEFLKPALIAEAKLVDQVVLGQYGNFLANSVGGLAGMTKTNVSDYIVDAMTKMNVNKVPETQRNMIWSPSAHGLALKNSLFVGADTSGDMGLAMREANLGRKFGFGNYYSTLTGEVTASNVTTVSGAINNAGGYAVGVTSLTVDGFSAAISNGSWFTVGGHAYRVVSTTGGSTPTVITLASPGLRAAVANDDVVVVYTPGAVNLAAGYAAGWTKEIALDGLTSGKAPAVGQLIAFGTATDVYTVVQVTSPTATTATVLLDRPLDAAIADDDKAELGPIGTYSFGFHRDAIALVVRPLAEVPAGAGAVSKVINYKGLSVRVNITYDGLAQGLRVTVDFLCGVKTLDTNLGVVMLG